MGDPLGSNSVALNNTGQVIAIQHDSPYGTGDFTWGTMPTSYIAPVTPVATAHGHATIGSLKVGEKVWAYKTQTKKMGLEPIQHVWLNHDTDLMDLTLVTPAKGPQGKTTQQRGYPY